MTENENLRLERLVLLIGTMLGQMAELLNYMKMDNSSFLNAYQSLFDIQKMAALQLHELYYKGNKQ